MYLSIKEEYFLASYGQPVARNNNKLWLLHIKLGKSQSLNFTFTILVMENVFVTSEVSCQYSIAASL